MRLNNINAHFKGPFYFQDFHVNKNEKLTPPHCERDIYDHLSHFLLLVEILQLILIICL